METGFIGDNRGESEFQWYVYLPTVEALLSKGFALLTTSSLVNLWHTQTRKTSPDAVPASWASVTKGSKPSASIQITLNSTPNQQLQNIARPTLL